MKCECFNLYKKEGDLWLIQGYNGFNERIFPNFELRPAVLRGIGLNKGLSLQNKLKIPINKEDKINSWKFNFKERNSIKKIQADNALRTITSGLLAIDNKGIYDTIHYEYMDNYRSKGHLEISYAINYPELSLERVKSLMFSMGEFLE